MKILRQKVQKKLIGYYGVDVYCKIYVSVGVKLKRTFHLDEKDILNQELKGLEMIRRDRQEIGNTSLKRVTSGDNETFIEKIIY